MEKRSIIPPLILVIGFCLWIYALPTVEGQEIQKKGRVKGKIVNGKYISPIKDFLVTLPQEASTGAWIEEQADSDGIVVEFSNDFGFLYRIVSLDNSDGSISVETAGKAFKNMRESKLLETVRGKELYVAAIEREGAKIVEKTAISTSTGQVAWKERIPDLYTANIVFQRGKRIYIVTAGIPKTQGGNDEKALSDAKKNAVTAGVPNTEEDNDVRRSSNAKKRVDEFITTIELMKGKSTSE